MGALSLPTSGCSDSSAIHLRVPVPQAEVRRCASRRQCGEKATTWERSISGLSGLAGVANPDRSVTGFPSREYASHRGRHDHQSLLSQSLHP